MPINIGRMLPPGEKNQHIAHLAPREWLLTPQIEALAIWLSQEGQTLSPGEYFADVGFQWHRGALSGGPVLAPDMLRRMADLGMYLILSQYAGLADEMPASDAPESAT